MTDLVHPVELELWNAEEALQARLNEARQAHIDAAAATLNEPRSLSLDEAVAVLGEDYLPEGEVLAANEAVEAARDVVAAAHETWKAVLAVPA